MNDDRQWRKSSFSGNTGNCVEVCSSEQSTVAVRDSKNVAGPELAFSDQAWAEFIRGVQHGEFDL
jgi:Domain of unknown function (DUF397)